jgi:hypothetical protein
VYTRSEAFDAAAEANAREIITQAIFNDTITLDGTNIIDMTVTEATNASDGISMGATISSKLEMTIKTPETPLVLNGGHVQPSVGFYTSELCPLGKFYISEAKSDNGFKYTFKIVAYDAFCKTEVPYVPQISMPNTAEAILGDIATQCGFSISSGIDYPDGEFGLYDFTCRQYIGYFAGLLGTNASFNRDGNLAFGWYTPTTYTIGRDQQHLGGFKRLTEEQFSVQSISSGTSDQLFTAGTGVGFSFENPFMTQDILENIFMNIGSFSYTPAQIKWRGNPAVEVGDIVDVEDRDGMTHTVYVMEQTFRIGGGMSSEIKCYGQSEAEISFSTSPTQKKLQQVYTKLQQAIVDATAVLAGANGGIFEVIDEDGDGINDGWIIHTVDGRKFIKANVNGIGITTDGGVTFTEALTAAGLNASAVTTGQLSAQRINVGDESLGNVFAVTQDDNGRVAVIIGAANSNIKQKQTNDAVTFIDNVGTPVAKFSTTGAEWDSLQQMKYCGFVWTKSQATGNVRFTKAEED